MLLLFGTAFSGFSNLFANEKTPYKILIKTLEAHNYNTSEATLETVLHDSILKLIKPELEDALHINFVVTFSYKPNISEVLTALLQAKYSGKSNAKVDFYKIQYSLHSDDFVRYLEHYPKSKYVLEAESKLKCTKQHEDWLKAAIKGSRNAYEAYARQYYTNNMVPLCKYEGYEAISQADNMQVQAIEAWLSLLKSEMATIWLTNGNVECEVYSNYLEKYGNSSCFASEANDSLNHCLDRNAWQQAMEKGTIEAYKVYVGEFPKGIHSRYAKGKIEDWTAWKTAREKDNYKGYLEYYKNFPKGDSIELAQKELIPNEANAVDLGLPSGTRWAPCNVGATSPEEYGDYYAWGEIQTKNDFSWKTYQYFTDKNKNGKPWTNGKADLGEITDIGNDISGTIYDVAYVKWGGDWKMPTKAQCQELVDKCKWTWWTTPDLQEGYKVTGPNGNSIFLPAAGFRYDTDLGRAGFRGGYWASNRDKSSPNNSYFLRFKKYDAFELNPVLHDVFANSLRYGRTVRPVTNVKPMQQTTDPAKQMPSFPIDTNITESTPVIIISGHNAVDLGLPSGTKWADRNIGSSSPIDYGEFYAWGETTTKKSYTWGTYKYLIDKNKNNWPDDEEELIDIGSDISGTEYDAAYMKWGGSWKMPTKEQWQELIDYCTWTFTAQESHKGYKVTGPNGRCIFLPVAGDKTDYGVYWSSTKRDKKDIGAFVLSFGIDKFSIAETGVCFEKNVRPVTK